MRVLVLGATGVLGRHTIPRLIERGHTVRAVVRSAQQAEALRRTGVEAVLGDILDPESLPSAAAGCDAALHLATAIPKPGGSGDWSLNDRIRREGTQNLLAACEQAGVRRYIQQSIIFLYGDQGARLVDETTPLHPAPFIQSAADMEAAVQASPLHWAVLRGGAFYGPGTGAEEAWRAGARAGTLRLPGEGQGLVSLIHVADMAHAVVLAMEHAPAAAVYNVVDDRPVSYRELYGFVAAQTGAPGPAPGGPVTRSLACSNVQIRTALGWAPFFPTYRSGLST